MTMALIDFFFFFNYSPVLHKGRQIWRGNQSTHWQTQRGVYSFHYIEITLDRHFVCIIQIKVRFTHMVLAVFGRQLLWNPDMDSSLLSH